MTQNELNELEEGKKWLEELILRAKDVQIPTSFTYLKRRIYQLRCSALNSNDIHPAHFKLIIRYLLGSGYIAYLLLKSKFSKNKISTPFSIWDSDIDPHVSCEAFNLFLNSDQIISLNKESFLFVKSNKNRKLFTHSYYSTNPIYDALSFLDIPYGDCFTLIKNIYKNLFIYLKISFTCPGSKGVFKDFLTEPIIKLYSKSGMVKLYRTNSNFSNQEFWCENIDFNTVWYSTNSRTIQYVNTSLGAIPEYPLFYYMFFGTSWTWSESNATWLKQFYNHKVHVVGPIMFYSLTPYCQKTTKKKRILIFDVTPHDEIHIRKLLLQKGLNYYNEKCCIKFISDILLALEGEDWEILLKPKRQYNSLHSKKYIDFLSKSKVKYNNFKILPAQSNLFDEIQNSDIVVSIPFSSPFDIAKSMNIPVIYFDPTGDVDFKAMDYDKDDFVNNVSSLKDHFKKIVTTTAT